MQPKGNITYYFIIISVFLLLNLGYSLATLDQLYFILKPTSVLISMTTGSVSNYTSESGFYFQGLDILLVKSCSGFNFMILCFTLLSFLGLSFADTRSAKRYVLPIALFIAYLITIVANASRIIMAIAGQRMADNFLPHRPHGLIHEIIGAVVYLFFLFVVYLFFKFLLQKLIRNNAKLA